jgi:hypothetical protein
MNGKELTIEEWLFLAASAMDEAQAENPEVEASELRNAYAAQLPPLTSRRAVQAYIACVAQGVAMDWVLPAEAKAYLYIAQMMLSAFGPAEAVNPTVRKSTESPELSVVSTVKKPRKARSN